MTTSVVSFANQNNLALYGMLHQVDHERRKVGIIILSNKRGICARLRV